MVFVNEDFAVDESFENFIAQNMRIETIYRQSYDPSPKLRSISKVTIQLLDPWENQFFELINLIINCLRFITTL